MERDHAEGATVPFGIGRSALRREDAPLVTGTATYIEDLELPGVLECSFSRSTIAHGYLRRIDLDAVQGAPGVVAAYADGDLDLNDIPEITTAAPVTVTEGMVRPPLARDRVRFVGEPVAVVVADGMYAAADAAELVDVDIDPLPAVVDAQQAQSGEPLLFPEVGSNVAAEQLLQRGDGHREDWPVSVELETEHPRLAPVSIETLGIAVRPEPGGGLTVWCGSQAPHRLRRQLSEALGLEQDRIRVIVPNVGGGFGTKNSLYPEYLVAAACARRLERPIRWVATRSENLIIGTHGRAQRHRIRLAGERDGRLWSARIDILGDVGAYPHNGAVVPMFTAAMGAGPYDIDTVTVAATAVVTNRAPTGPYRGAGRPEITFSLERAIDAFAHEAGIDPAEVRRRNFVPPSAMPYDNGVGSEYDSGEYAAALSLALELADVPAVREEQRRRLEHEESRLLGLGIGAFVERAGASARAPEYARVELTPSGTLLARVGSADTGQGHATTWSQIVADVFAISDPDTVAVITGDTAEVAQGTGSFGSRSTQTGGSAVLRCSRELRRQITELTARTLECNAADVMLEDGWARIRGDPAAGVKLSDLPGLASERGIELMAEESYSLGTQTYPYGTYVCVVEVDRETGWVAIRNLVAVDDCGTVVNPQIVEGQIHGSAAQGLGQALFEEFVYDEQGQPVTATLMDYSIPAAPDLTTMVSEHTSTPSPVNTLGAKGTGEAGCIGAPPAVVNAVIDALRPLGVTDIRMPLTPERVWRAIRDVTPERQR